MLFLSFKKTNKVKFRKVNELNGYKRRNTEKIEEKLHKNLLVQVVFDHAV